MIAYLLSLLLAPFLRELGLPDWLDAELVIVLAMAAGGVFVMWESRKTHERDADERIELHARIATLEQAVGLTRPTSIDARVAEVEGWIDGQDVNTRERLATVEARIDHKPITHTRRKDGKFAKAEDVLEGKAT